MRKLKDTKKSIAVIAGVALVVLAAGASVAFLLTNVKEKMNQSANETLLASTRMIKSSLESALAADEKVLAAFSRLLSSGAGADRFDRDLEQFMAAGDFYGMTFVRADKKGIVERGAPDADPEGSLSWGSTDSSYSKAYYGDMGRLQITFRMPVMHDGERFGTLYADKALSEYFSPAVFAFSGGEGHAYVVDSGTGEWIIESTGTDKDNIFTFLKSQNNGPEICEALKDVMRDGRTGTIGIRYKGEACFLCFMPFDEANGWYLVSVIPRRILQREASDMIRMIYVILAVLLGTVILVLALLLSRQSMKEQEKARIYRERLFQNISANVDFAFLLYSPVEKEVQLVSENVRFLFGIEEEQVLKEPALLFEQCGVPGEDPGMKQFFEGTLLHETQKEYRISARDNELQRWVDIHFIPTDGGHCLAVLHDTTGEHHMRENLAEALKQSQESNRTRTAFFSSVSHDIRTPMNGIMGMTAIALEHVENPDKVRNCLEKINASSGHLLALINEILDMSRLESGGLKLRREPVHLPDMISSLLTFIKPELLKKEQCLRIRSSVLVYDTVMGDELHMQKILLNILSNAVKYTPAKGNIILEVEEKNVADGKADLFFAVQDDGIGMSREFLKRIFNPFERADDKQVDRIMGTGLGMAITKNIVDLMDGSIKVESEQGKGSRFEVMIPVALSEGKEADPVSLKGRRALVVDDDPDTCVNVRLMLKEAGMISECAVSGEEALTAVQKAHEEGNDYFAVILDWRMPDMDGIETARHIRAEIGNEIPIILLSAYDWEEAEQEGLKVGINGFLTKPIFKSALFATLKRQISGMTENAVKVEETCSFPNVRVLMAEDNPLNREIMEELLRGHGVETDSVKDGQEALQKYMESSPGYYDMIFLDIHMPVMGGYKTASKIRKTSRVDAASIPIIAMTADVFEEEIQKCYEAGMNAHLGKPIDPDRLLKTVRMYQKAGKGKKDEKDN